MVWRIATIALGALAMLGACTEAPVAGDERDTSGGDAVADTATVTDADVGSADTRPPDDDIADTPDARDTTNPSPDPTVFTVEVDPPLGQWTEDFTADTDCTCRPDRPSCHALYVARAQAVDGHEVTLEVAPAPSLGKPGPSVSVDAWVVHPSHGGVSCAQLPSYPSTAVGTWAAQQPLTTVAAAWSSAQALAAAPCGDTRYVAVASGGGDQPSAKRWFQARAVRLRKVCGTTAGGCGACTRGPCQEPMCEEPPWSTLWGLGEPVVWNTLGAGKHWDLDDQLERVVDLAPKLVRLWIDVGHFLAGDGTIDEAVLATYQTAVAALQDQGDALVIGMDSSFAGWMTGGSKDVVPCRDAAPGSAYQSFLDAWERGWEVKVARFPTILHWEAGNEWNHGVPFLTPRDGCAAGGEFSLEERVAIAMDLWFRAKRAIDRLRPEATVFMGGLSPKEPVAFLETLYRRIERGDGPSSDPRDFYDAAAWHPYLNADPATGSWAAYNDALHSVLEAHGDGDIPVLLSEMGYTDGGSAFERYRYADWLRAAAQSVREDMPWVWGVAWFRAFNDTAFPMAHPEHGFGLLDDDFAWKPAAYTAWSIAANPRPPNAPVALELVEQAHALAVIEGTLEADAGGWRWIAGGGAAVSVATPAIAWREGDVLELVCASDGHTVTAQVGTGMVVPLGAPRPDQRPTRLTAVLPAPDVQAAALTIAFQGAHRVGIDSVRVLRSP